MDIKILYEDESILIAVKLPMVPSQPDKTGDMDLLTALSSGRPGLGLVHRLDRPVGGVMVFSKNKSTAALLSEQIQKGSFQKTYGAVVCGRMEIGKEEELRNYMVKNQKTNTSIVVNANIKQAKEAVLSYRVMGCAEDEEYGFLSLLNIALKTGRHHQIRVQLSHIGAPIWGDIKYNPFFQKKGNRTKIALWAEKVQFQHPFLRKNMAFVQRAEGFPFSLFYSGQ